MDLQRYSALKTDAKWLVLLDIDGNETDGAIELYSIDSNIYQDAMRKINKEQAKRKEEMSPVEFMTKLCSSCTKGWRGLKMGDTELNFNPQTADWFYNEYPIFREQVGKFITDRQIFFQA